MSELFAAECNCETGEIYRRALTADELAAYEAHALAVSERNVIDERRAATAATIKTRLRERIAELESLADKLAAGTATAAERTRALEVACRGVARLTRLTLSELNGGEGG